MYKKIKKIAKKAFSSKTYVLALINRYIPKNFGKIINLNINRESKNIFIELERENKLASIEVVNYTVHTKNNKHFLVYEDLATTGFIKPMLMVFKKQREIEIEPKYVRLIHKFIKN